MPKMPSYKDPKEKWVEYELAEKEYWKSSEGMAIREEAEREKERRRARAIAATQDGMARTLIAMGMPERAIKAMDGDVIETDATRAASGALDLLVLSGGPGCGKTVAAAMWVASFVRNIANWDTHNDPDYCIHPKMISARPVWVTAAKLARWERYEQAEMEKLLKTPRLVIDDLGGEFLDKGGFYASLLDEVVNERQGESRPTIMTTNLDAEAFKSRYGERITDRIREGGRFVGCGSDSLRRKPTT
jgi:DNA replication protein DnaC